MLKRPRSSEVKKIRISQALRGRKWTPEQNAARSAALKGRKWSPESLEKAAITKKKNAELRKQGKKAFSVKEQKSRKLRRAVLEHQMRIDIRKALEQGKFDLAVDIFRSQGLWVYRKMHDPSVSDGVFKGKVYYYPHKIHLRLPHHPPPEAGWARCKKARERRKAKGEQE